MLKEPAELRIIASSVQVISEDHGFEKWANFPHERQRLFQLIAKTRAQGVIFISDRLAWEVKHHFLDLLRKLITLNDQLQAFEFGLCVGHNSRFGKFITTLAGYQQRPRRSRHASRFIIENQVCRN